MYWIVWHLSGQGTFLIMRSKFAPLIEQSKTKTKTKTKNKTNTKRNKTKNKTKQKQKQNKARNLKIGFTISKWRPKIWSQTRNINFPTKNGKTTFPKEFFHKIWLIIGECKYNYIAEIKFIQFRFNGINKFWKKLEKC